MKKKSDLAKFKEFVKWVNELVFGTKVKKKGKVNAKKVQRSKRKSKDNVANVITSRNTRRRIRS